MKTGINKRFAFIGKSLLWSLLLYSVLMVVINWDDVNNTLHGRSSTALIHVSPVVDRQILEPHTASDGVLNTISGLLQAVTRFAK